MKQIDNEWQLTVQDKPFEGDYSVPTISDLEFQNMPCHPKNENVLVTAHTGGKTVPAAYGIAPS